MASCAKNYKSGVLGKHVMSESEEAEEDRYRKIGRDAETIWEAETIRPFTVLLVEDDALTSKLVAKSLRAYTFDVMEAQNGQVALNILKSDEGKRVDMVLTDNMMPEISGIELVGKVVSMKGAKHPTMIVMSSFYHDDTRSRALEAGASDFLVKPLNEAKFALLWRHARRSSRPQEGSRKISIPSTGEKRVSRLLPVARAAAKGIQASATSAFQPLPSGKRAAEHRLFPGLAKRPQMRKPVDPAHKQLWPTVKEETVSQGDETAPTCQAISEASDRDVQPILPSQVWDNTYSGGLLDAARLRLLGGQIPQQLLHASLAAPRGSLNFLPPRFEIKPLRTERSLSSELPAIQTWLAGKNAPLSDKQQGGIVHEGSDTGVAGHDSLQHKVSGSAFSTVSLNGGSKPEVLPQQQLQIFGQKQPYFGLPVQGLAISSAVMQHHHQQQQQLLFQALSQAARPQIVQSKVSTTANRKAAIEKFRAKRKQRSFQKKVRYTSRQRLAENRPRVRGQFVKASSHDGDDTNNTSPTPDTGGQQSETPVKAAAAPFEVAETPVKAAAAPFEVAETPVKTAAAPFEVAETPVKVAEAMVPA